VKEKTRAKGRGQENHYNMRKTGEPHVGEEISREVTHINERGLVAVLRKRGGVRRTSVACNQEPGRRNRLRSKDH